jgi:hypothetical protein
MEKRLLGAYTGRFLEGHFRPFYFRYFPTPDCGE